MAASGSTSPPIAVPYGFHYETKYVVLNYLGLLPTRSHGSTAGQGNVQMSGEEQSERDRIRAMKGQIEHELRQLEDEIAASFASTGFDRHSSPVFSPRNPDGSIEDCLAALGDRVAKDLGPNLATAVHTLLSSTLDYQSFRETTLAVSIHAQGGWDEVLVPLVLLQALQSEGMVLASLLAMGVRYLEEAEADYIIQQGGWATVFTLAEEEEPGVVIAGDSNDIYILSGEQHSDQLSTPPSLFCAEDNGSGPGSWQTESLPASLAGHESWAHIAMTDPDDAKSLDSNDGAALAEERSDNNSSNSDIVHVEREEAELLEEASVEGGGATAEEPGLQESMMSILGTESDLAELRAEFSSRSPPPPVSTETESVGAAAESPPSLEEEPLILKAPEISLTLPAPASSEPEPEPGPELQAQDVAETAPHLESQHAPLAVIAIEPDPEPEVLLHPADPVIEITPQSPTLETSTPAPTEPLPAPEPTAEAEPDEVPLEVEEPSGVRIVAEPEDAALLNAPSSLPVTEARSIEHAEQPEPAPEPTSDSEFPLLLFGGAIVALAAVAAYGAMAYRKK